MRNFTPRKPIFQPQTDTCLIPLTRDHHATVDAVDVDLADVLWWAQPVLHTVYAYRKTSLVNGKQKTVLLHRVILERMLDRDLLTDEHVDHKDGNGLNNTRDNLRLATREQNMANSRKRSDNTSGFKGVCWYEQSGKWRAYIMVGGKKMHLGYFTSKEAAYAAYCTAAEKYHGEFANDGTVQTLTVSHLTDVK